MATTFRAIDVDAVLDPSKASWCSFDPEIGYVPRDAVLKDGMDYSRTTYRYEPSGERRIVNFPERQCRVNTYGDSFTHCQQVSDDESWQERLAAHIGEPIRNFGIGGHSVLTASKRARRVEAGERSSEYIILTIYDDNHVRNLDASRWIRTQWNERDRPKDHAWPLHGLPWTHVRYDLSARRFVELPGACRSEEDLRGLCDPDRFYRTFHDDQIVRLFALEKGGEARFDDLEQIAEELGIRVDLRNPFTRPGEAAALHRRYGLKSTEFVLDGFIEWAARNHKKLLVPLVYCEQEIINYLKGGERFDASFIEYLDKKRVVWLDGLQKHREDYASFRIAPEKYIDRYFIKPTAAAVFGHYNPIGNVFFAFAIKDDIVNWLNPKPPAYAN